VLKGAGQSIGVLIYTAGPGVTAGTPAHLKPTIPAAILRVAGGGVVVAMAARGLIDRYRSGHRSEVLAVTHVGGWMLLAFAVGAQGVALGRIPLIAEHLRDGRLVAPFPKRYDSARGYYAVVAPHAAERPDVIGFVSWLADEAAHEAGRAKAAELPSSGNPPPGKKRAAPRRHPTR
jgi:DNA-binding transcriptional LysR family regulator